MSSPILVTGAAGFAGGHLLEYLDAPGDVVAWSRSSPPAELAPRAQWHPVDLLDRNRVRRAIDDLRPAVIYHCAGMSQVAPSWTDRAQPFAQNVLATHYLLDAVRRAGIACRILIPGSATVYAPSNEPLSERHPVGPTSPYGLSKLAQEELALRAFREDGIDVVVTRSFNHTGPRQAPAFAAPSMARQIALIERGRADPVLRVGNLDTRRDLTDVRDVVRAYALLIRSGAPATIYNVASGAARPIRAVLEGLVARARVAVRIETDPARLRPVDVPALIGDPARLHAATGWHPVISFDRMLDDLLEYWRKRVELEPGW